MEPSTVLGHKSEVAPVLPAAAYVVLGMIHLGARSGYEIQRDVGDSIRFFWTISPVQVYPSLGQLEGAGYVTGRDESRGRRPRRVYEITPAGTSALRHWLLDQSPMPFELRDMGMVKLFLADSLDSTEALELLSAVRERSTRLVATLGVLRPKAEAAARSGNAYPALTLEMGLAFHEAIIAGCDNFAIHLNQSKHGNEIAPV
jgi:DNA-binding PadR family transcriptional regulator